LPLVASKHLSRSLFAGAVACALSSPVTPAKADIDARRLAPLIRHGARPSVFFGDDGRLPLLVRLEPGLSAESLGLLEVAPGFGAIRLSPDELDAFVALHPDVRPQVAPLRHTLLDLSRRWTHAHTYRAQTGFDGTGVVVGIIDTGLDTMHPDFLDEDGKSRVAWLMVRDLPRGLHRGLEQAYGCDDDDQSPCAIYSAEDLDNLRESDPDTLPRDVDGHGTHVASIAAGNGGPSVVAAPRYVGLAPGATLIIASPAGGGGFADPDILRAARFIFDRAEALGMPAVINISLGSDFGPHDGTSALESGLAALVGDDKPGRVIVVAAGNSGTLYDFEEGGPYGIHTEAHVSPHAVTRVAIDQPGADGPIEGAGFVWVTFRPGDDVNVGLEGPDGEWIPLTPPGNEHGYETDSVSGGVVNNLVNGKTSLNPNTNSAVVFWEGRWEAGRFAVLLRGRGDAQLWVTGTGGAGPGRTLGLAFARALKAGTISAPASHPDLLAVGCTLNRIRWVPLGEGDALELQTFGPLAPPIEDSTCYFSAAGPTPGGVMKPDLLAPGGIVAAAMSRDADPRAGGITIFSNAGCPEGLSCFVVDEGHAITSGTSMSSPHVTGGAALVLQRDPNLTQRQVREILQAGAARPTGVVPYDYQAGPGELDMLGALQVMDEGTVAQDVDVASSWYVLATPYARPDPTYPVRGTIELRHADRTIAFDVPPADLQVVVTGGSVVEPLTRVRAGLWTFAVAAPRGSGGTELTIDVRYRGASLGVRTLPVGVDAWVASSGVEGVGGCAVVGPARSPRLAAALVAVALALGASRRRTRLRTTAAKPYYAGRRDAGLSARRAAGVSAAGASRPRRFARSRG
jgi:subtilisin family serine protease